MHIKYSPHRIAALIVLNATRSWVRCDHPSKRTPLNSRTLCSLYDDGYLDRKVITTWRKSSRRRINIVLYRLKSGVYPI